MNEKWFVDWFNSPYYHILYNKRDESDADFFIQNLLNFLQPTQDSSILDVACGKGRHAILMADKGFEVTGIDISENSIAEALPHEHDKLHFYTHDMRLPFWINYFDYTFNFFTSFGYFRTHRENQNAIHSIASSLKPSGICMIDYLNPDKAIANIKQEEQVIINNICFSINRWYDEKKIYKKILVDDHNNGQQSTFMEAVERFNINDFESLFNPVHLQIKHIFGEYDLTPFDSTHSSRMILIAQKTS